jgi:hypothetical protein
MNKDYKRRDEIIFGGYWEDRYKYGGCANDTIDYKQLKSLIDEDFIDMDECQNDSPTTQDFVDAISGYEDNVLFEVYAISPQRDDYRVTIEGIELTVPMTDLDQFIYFIEQFRYADEFEIHSDNDYFYIRAWWD